MEQEIRIIDIEQLRTKQYERNVETYGDGGCIICGRPLNDRDMDAGKWLHWLPTGEVTDSQADLNIADNADLGWWQVGCTCYKNFLKAAHTIPVKTWKY